MTEIKGPLKIVALTAQNLMRLSAVHIAPDGSLIKITGKNGAGKTSVLNAIWLALDPATSGVVKPIRDGANKGRVKLDMGEVIVERVFTRRDDGGTNMTIRVTAADGSRFARPQSVLDGLLSALTLDPGRFLRMKPDDQAEVMRSFVSDVDFAAIEAENRADFEERTEQNRTAKRAETQAATITVPPDTPDEPVDTDALTTELGDVGEFNAQIERRKERRQQAAKDAANLRENAQGSRKDNEGLRRQIAELEKQITDNEEIAKNDDDRAAAMEQQLAEAEPLPEPKDAADVRARLEAAQETNRTVEAKKRKASLLAEQRAAAARSQELTDAMEERDAAVRRKIAAAKMPVEGLGLGPNLVTFHGQPLSQTSHAEQVRVSMAIAMAMNPTLRVVRIAEGGNDLDEDSMAIVARMAEEAGCQVWMELVDSSGEIGIVIEDGHVKGEAPTTITTADGTVADAETGEVLEERPPADGGPTDAEIKRSQRKHERAFGKDFAKDGAVTDEQGNWLEPGDPFGEEKL